MHWLEARLTPAPENRCIDQSVEEGYWEDLHIKGGIAGLTRCATTFQLLPKGSSSLSSVGVYYLLPTINAIELNERSSGKH